MANDGIPMHLFLWKVHLWCKILYLTTHLFVTEAVFSHRLIIVKFLPLTLLLYVVFSYLKSWITLHVFQGNMEAYLIVKEVDLLLIFHGFTLFLPNYWGFHTACLVLHEMFQICYLSWFILGVFCIKYALSVDGSFLVITLYIDYTIVRAYLQFQVAFDKHKNQYYENSCYCTFVLL